MTFGLELKGRRALVTGAGQGVGRGIVHGLAAAGADVIVNDLRIERAQEVADEIGGTAAAFDVTDYDAVTDAIAALDDVDILVNNAGNAGAEGFAGLGRFVDTRPSDWEPFFRVNLYGVLHCTHAVLPGMIDRGWGRVITISSDSGRTGEANMAAYAASKAGAAGLTRALAVETGRYGITVNTIALGTMRTEATEGLWADPDNPHAKQLLRRYAVRRPGLPEDAAALTVFLASGHASWITGQTYPVNGGISFAQ
ncbi:SDR family NAD(P)-dependent oxidoreductase [Cryptosporangium aurantiacum]|uniref:3-oxoacyl-[acyl-carrier protein] reductase n=1 Tax=Cryptosporangium aurantiacum TaxID=134849 RepID=A0A1M7R9U2_9ACTN|nr:SDR family NAD(P)-dependent oxidoreductase [Cryptosporangium aurantiacum]SHN43087.1 3-oxoacyl-[acyl-carrier protein] reductase [Cryptosporangium aurantiacum]